ncbi:HNH endonuclease [Myroides odoratimimus]|uniref:HNH endonuclease n=1 Tax=Myroides odoratimimus TaxID=76832 RepID=UPI00370A6801
MKEIKTEFDATLHYGYDDIIGLEGLVIESGGGNRNVDHSILFRDILGKLSNINARNVSIFVAARPTSSNDYPDLKYRQVTYNDESNFDFKLIDLDDFIISVNNEIREKGKIDPTKSGGSVHKRLLFSSDLTENDWINLLLGKSSQNIQNQVFVNDRSEDELEYVYQKVKKRIKQSKFRRELLLAYNNTCAVTGSKVIQLLEAAHIQPYNGGHTSVIKNGILLRSDIHDLFDLCIDGKRLLNITKDFIVEIDSTLMDSEYGQFNGKKILLPSKEEWKSS